MRESEGNHLPECSAGVDQSWNHGIAHVTCTWALPTMCSMPDTLVARPTDTCLLRGTRRVGCNVGTRAIFLALAAYGGCIVTRRVDNGRLWAVIGEDTCYAVANKLRLVPKCRLKANGDHHDCSAGNDKQILRAKPERHANLPYASSTHVLLQNAPGLHAWH